MRHPRRSGGIDGGNVLLVLGDADRRLVAACNLAIQACGVLLLAVGQTTIPLALGCVLFGLGIGNLLTPPPLIAQREFRAADVPQVVALVTAINQAVFAFAPTVIGLLRDATGNYTLAFALAAAVQLVAGAVVMRGRANPDLGLLRRD
jgi:cyanate permease